jgi:hypothetical protein
MYFNQLLIRADKIKTAWSVVIRERQVKVFI